MGIAVALVQKEHLTDTFRDNAFYLSVCFAVAAALLLLSFREPIARLLGQPVLVNFFPLLAAILITRIMSSVYRSLLLRAYDYKKIALIEFFAYLAYALPVIGLVSLGWDVEALLWSQWISALVALLSFGYLNRLIPHSPFSFRTWGELLNFGGWVAFNRILAQAAGHVDRFIIVTLVSPVALGGYYLAQHLATAGPNMIAGAVEQTTLPVYSRGQGDLSKLEAQYWKAVKVGMVVMFPMIIIPASHAGVLFELIYGDRWLFAAELFQIISFFALIGAMGGGLFGSVLYATGRTREIALTGLFRLVTLPPCILVGNFFGLTGIAWGLVVFGVIGRIFNQYVMQYALGFRMRRFFVTIWRFLLLALIVGAVGWNATTDFISMLIFAIIQFCLWLFGVYLIARPEVMFLKQQIMSRH